MNYITIKMHSHPENISFARMAIAAFIAPLDPSVDEVSDTKTAVSEAVTNAIIHGYPNCIIDNAAEQSSDCADTQSIPRFVRMTMSHHGRTITIEVADDGVGIADIAIAREPLFTTKADLERSGLGFTVMESFMDSVAVVSTPGEGTKVTLTKTLAEPAV